MAFQPKPEELKLRHQVTTTVNDHTYEIWQFLCTKKQASSHSLLRDVIMEYCHREILKAGGSRAYSVLDTLAKRQS
jgi:hypothetical protein